MITSLFPSANSAVISACGTYRYRLVRDLGGGRTLVVGMVNPSTATAETNDPTIRRVIAFARAWGFGRVIVVNLCAFRATDIRELARAADPIGPENDAHILVAAAEADMIVAAWGVRSKLPPALRGRCDQVLGLLADREVIASGGRPAAIPSIRSSCLGIYGQCCSGRPRESTSAAHFAAAHGPCSQLRTIQSYSPQPQAEQHRDTCIVYGVARRSY